MNQIIYMKITRRSYDLVIFSDNLFFLNSILLKKIYTPTIDIRHKVGKKVKKNFVYSSDLKNNLNNKKIKSYLRNL